MEEINNLYWPEQLKLLILVFKKDTICKISALKWLNVFVELCSYIMPMCPTTFKSKKSTQMNEHKNKGKIDRKDVDGQI